MVDMVVKRPELRATLIRIIGILMNRAPSATVVPLGSDGRVPAKMPRGDASRPAGFHR
jgi:hypothetical protein